MYSSTLKILENTDKPRVLVVGDLILDRYVWGDVQRISPEAPIPVMNMEQGREESRLGGAGNVAQNIVSLGGRGKKGASCSLAGVLGNDSPGKTFRKLAKACKISCRSVLAKAKHPTTLKTRFMAGGQQILRSDIEIAEPISQALSQRLLQAIGKSIAKIDVILISDYGKGVLSKAMIKGIFNLAKKRGIPIMVDPKGKDYARYRGCTVITPNKKEAQEATGIEIHDEKSLKECARALQSLTRCHWAVITLGKEGVYALGKTSRKPHKEIYIKTEARTVFDVTGAGDTFLAALGFAVAAGADFEDALRLANVAAGLAVAKLGTAAVTKSDIQTHLGVAATKHLGGKLKTVAQLEKTLLLHRERGDRIVFTNGCFDILHAGHVRYLAFARNQGDVLVVGLNSDRSVKNLKDKHRPIVAQRERAEILAALEDVDYLCIFHEDTPLKLIKKLKPEVLVKGEDWQHKGVVGREFVERRGGRVILAPLKAGDSTTNVIENIIHRYGKGSG